LSAIFFWEHNPMTVTQELARMLDEAAKARTWGAIEIALQDGRPTIIKTTTTTKLEESNPSVRSQRY
jgi:hypothetical protein